MALSTRDKQVLLRLLENSQLVYLLSRYPKRQVLDDAKDVARLEDGLAKMRTAAKDISASLRERHPAVRWDEIADRPDSVELAWLRAKRVAPTVLRELTPLLAGEPEAAFFLDASAEAKASNKTSNRTANKTSNKKIVLR